MAASTLTVFAAYDEDCGVTDIAVLDDRKLVASTRVFSEWPWDWNDALRVRGFEVSAPWIAGAPLWAVNVYAGTREYTTHGVGRCAALR
jgi:hypothetical protein